MAGVLKILFLQDHQETGGAARAAQRYRAVLAKVGHVTAVACGDGVESAEVFRLHGKLPRGAGRIVQICLPPKWRNHWMKSRVERAWQQALARFQPDLVWSHNLHGAAKWGWSLSMIPQACSRVPVVWTLHDMAPLGGGTAYWPETEMESRSACSPFRHELSHISTDRLCLSAPSAWLASLVRQASGRSCAILPYPIQLELFSPGDQRTARRKLGLPEEGRIFLAGAERVDDPRKGLLLLDGVSDLLKEKGITLAFFGRNGRAQTGQSYLGVLQDETAMRDAYRAADMYLHLADQDNAPCQIQESLACGTPVLAFRVGGVPEMIQDGVTGFLLNRAEPQEFRKAFAGALETGLGSLGGMRIACRQDSEARYAPKTLVAQIEKLFRDVLDLSRSD